MPENWRILATARFGLSKFVTQDGLTVRLPFRASVGQLDLPVGRHPLRLASRRRVSEVFVATPIVGLG